ncbi:5-keto-D-gluconate 5-reductase [Seminavis robusta]|uniref:3-oxoacyl-[acyl-carrier-protein] reductase n=1 Tax=Seminavis robusta TaxID=568900 RepID=A0A9N8ETQ4_9STRA|nr:5-keto-D-gluconate 5-reductase [Seminavis robusta]|eukprot:Sro1666_g289710.1 5-keto-D-gluconate 5-reductase (272) ;mRNA; f:14727-15542
MSLQLGSSSLKGRRALVCASTRGLGLGTAKALLQLEVDSVAINGRTTESVKAAIDKLIQDSDDQSIDQQRLVAAPGDVSTQEGRTAVLKAAGPVQILVNNAGGPPPGDFDSFDESAWHAALEQNMVAPLMLAKAAIPYMKDKKWGRIVNITSASVRAPIPILCLSNGARAGLTGAMAGIARQVACDGITVNNVLPGQHDTDRLRSNHETLAARQGVEVAQVRKEAQNKIPTKSFGDPNDFGAIVAFLCTDQAKFIVGQNIMVDGGAANISI